MWMLVLFDLPTKTKENRRAHAQFRQSLLKYGFRMLQFSVYSRHCASRDQAESQINRVAKILPAEGEIRVIQLTDNQFERMQVFRNFTVSAPEKAPDQLEFW